ncbi:DUF4133 domain-containing protein [Flagellimonas pacifica]|uniref:DUF4133 domain-containing protein n=1 Tax=Flagellimonas pacifica TaxID=1247520 RepID=A0A285MW18_9FLAO|nr:DUF4133 domain-containing protein [Allomuricauda parva]SNZ01308.1 protein of unknown function [Allomuricauda parva]
MEGSFSLIRKGLQKDVLYKGLKAKYINYSLYFGFAAIIMGLVLSTLVPMVLALICTTVLIAIIFLILLFYSRTYGANGFVKKLADSHKPKAIKISNSYENLLLWKNR